jgi:hypothetical protein
VIWSRGARNLQLAHPPENEQTRAIPAYCSHVQMRQDFEVKLFSALYRPALQFVLAAASANRGSPLMIGCVLAAALGDRQS